MAGAIGSDVALSHMMVVSRWLVTPMPATSVTATPLLCSASAAVSRCAVQISSGSCSTQPGCGKSRPISRCASDRTPPSAANTMARALVVPWSRARITRPSFDSPAIVPPIRSAVSASIIASGGAGPFADAERSEHGRALADDLEDDRDGAGGDVFVRHRERHALAGLVDADDDELTRHGLARDLRRLDREAHHVAFDQLLPVGDRVHDPNPPDSPATRQRDPPPLRRRLLSYRITRGQAAGATSPLCGISRSEAACLRRAASPTVNADMLGPPCYVA